MTARLALLALVIGCSAAGDGQGQAALALGVPASLSPVQLAAVEDAAAQWCASSHRWCPAVVVDAPWAPMQLSLALGPTIEPGQSEGVAAQTDLDTGRVAIYPWGLRRPELWWVIVAHEMGHLQGLGHHGGPECTMFWRQDEPSYTLTCE